MEAHTNIHNKDSNHNSKANLHKLVLILAYITVYVQTKDKLKCVPGMLPEHQGNSQLMPADETFLPWYLVTRPSSEFNWLMRTFMEMSSLWGTESLRSHCRGSFSTFCLIPVAWTYNFSSYQLGNECKSSWVAYKALGNSTGRESPFDRIRKSVKPVCWHLIIPTFKSKVSSRLKIKSLASAS